MQGEGGRGEVTLLTLRTNPIQDIAMMRTTMPTIWLRVKCGSKVTLQKRRWRPEVSTITTVRVDDKEGRRRRRRKTDDLNRNRDPD